MAFQEFLNKWGFMEDDYYKVVNGVVHRNVIAGLIEDDEFKKTTRRVGKYRIVAWHFNCALPYTKYFLITEKTVYAVEKYPIWTPNILRDMVSDLSSINGGD